MNASLFTLPNGLRVVHHYDPATRLAAVNVLYGVGSRHDPRSHRGMAHLMEHLMFGGSINVADFDAELELAGGTNNAWTSDDFTNFWDAMPSHNIETAFWLESDRMLSLAFSEESLETQRKVVVEEFKQVCLNQPYGDLQHHLRRLLYSRHAYRIPTIGASPADIESVTMNDVRRFYRAHYAPGNAVLAVAGNIDLQTTRRLAEKWFAGIPARPTAKRRFSIPPEPSAPKRLKVTADVPQTCITIAYPMCGYFGEHYIGADLLTDVLAAGRSSRFYTRLLSETDLFTSVDASIAGLEETGFLMANAMLRDGADPARAEAAILAELQRTVDAPPEATELQRVLNNYESSFEFGQVSCLAKAQRLAMAVMRHESPDCRLRQYLAATPAQIHAAARVIIAPHRSRTLIYGN